MYMFILCSFFIPYVIYTAMKLWLCKAHGMCAPVYVNQSKSEQHNKVVLYRYMLATLRKLYMLYAVGVSTTTLQRGNLMCSMLWVWAHPYFREETLCAVCCVCEHTHTSEERPYVLFIVGVESPIPLLRSSLVFRHARCSECDHIHAILSSAYLHLLFI